MKTAADVILALEANSSRNKKEEIIADAWKQGIVEFFEGWQRNGLDDRQFLDLGLQLAVFTHQNTFLGGRRMY